MRIISLFLVPWVISIAVTVLFSYLIVGSSKLFLSQPLSFVPPIALSSPFQGEREWEWGASEWHMVWRVSVEALNWGVPILNHNSFI